jgi:hypothetical protein
MPMMAMIHFDLAAAGNRKPFGRGFVCFNFSHGFAPFFVLWSDVAALSPEPHRTVACPGSLSVYLTCSIIEAIL